MLPRIESITSPSRARMRFRTGVAWVVIGGFISTVCPYLSAHGQGQPEKSNISTWQIDIIQSTLSFSVRHILSSVRGEFTQWSGKIIADPQDWSTASVTVTVQAASVTTGNSDRDADLRGTNLFDVKKFPTLTFVSTKVTRDGDSVKVFGNLTLHGVTKPVVLAGKLAAMSKTDDGKNQASFTATTTINRTDYGVVWSRLTEGAFVVGDDVTIDMNVIALQQ